MRGSGGRGVIRGNFFNDDNMKLLKTVTVAALLPGLLTTPLAALATDQKHGDAESTDAKARPYPLNTGVVSDEKLRGTGKPYAFVHEGQEIKPCCKSCLKDFDKEPVKYVKKLADAQKGAKHTSPNAPTQDHGGHTGHQH